MRDLEYPSLQPEDFDGPMKALGFLGAVVIVGVIVGGALPGWAQMPAMLVVAAMAGFGLLTGGVGGMVRSIGTVFKWTWPFWIWAAARWFLLLTPIAAVMPEDRQDAAISVTAPVLVSIAGFLFWRFARFQELARDVGVILSLIVHVITIGTAFYNGEMARDVAAWALGSLSITLGISAVVYLPPQRTVFTRAGIASALGAVVLMVSVLFVPVKPLSEVVADAIEEQKNQLVEKLTAKVNELGVPESVTDAAKAGFSGGLSGLKDVIARRSSVLGKHPNNRTFEPFPVNGERTEYFYGRKPDQRERTEYETAMAVSDLVRMEIRANMAADRSDPTKAFDMGAISEAQRHAIDTLKGAGLSDEMVRAALARAYAIEAREFGYDLGTFEVGPFPGYVPTADMRVGWENAVAPKESVFMNEAGQGQLNLNNRPGWTDKVPFMPLGRLLGVKPEEIRYVEPLDLSNTRVLEVLENE